MYKLTQPFVSLVYIVPKITRLHVQYTWACPVVVVRQYA